MEKNHHIELSVSEVHWLSHVSDLNFLLFLCLLPADLPLKKPATGHNRDGTVELIICLPSGGGCNL